MPLELGIWRIDTDLKSVDFGRLDLESRLEDILDEDISIASPNWMVVGRQVRTPSDGIIDLLVIDQDGNLVVVELKRDRTPRDIVAQVLDYGSWVRTLEAAEVARIFEDYLKRYHPDRTDDSINDAFLRHFGGFEMPEELNEGHALVIVASQLDPSTERIVNYLSDEHGVSINAVFFRVFRDGDREYLSRVWFRDPTSAEISPREPRGRADWNGEYYGSFGADDARVWEEAVQYGFTSGGGGSWYSNTLKMLSPGDRLWVNIPRSGYVGVGRVVESAVPVDDFTVEQDGQSVPLISLPVAAAKLSRAADDEEKAEYLVRMDWIGTVAVEKAVREKGFFGNQNTVARPKDPKWDHTVERLKKRFGVE